VGLLAGALFAAAVNLVTASGALGNVSGLTLVDKIHVVVLGYILIAAVVAVVSRILVERGWQTGAIARLNYRVGLIAAISFVAINVLLIAFAARGG
jgi:purine-cytosine permease-like protein